MYAGPRAKLERFSFGTKSTVFKVVREPGEKIRVWVWDIWFRTEKSVRSITFAV